jgi:hypothetical protein
VAAAIGTRDDLTADEIVVLRAAARQRDGAPIDSRLLPMTRYLVAHCEDTSHRYPSLARDGYSGPDGSSELDEFARSLDPRRLAILLGLLQEADALAAVGRVWEQSLSRGLDRFGQPDPANAWCWEESAAGNVLLAAKRALLDARSATGQAQAHDAYDRSVAFVEAVCHEYGQPFVRETFQRVGRPDVAPAPLNLRRYLGRAVVEQRLRAVTLLLDPSLRPYENARIEITRRRISELSPIASYVLDPQLDLLRRIHATLASRYALSLFDLSGLIEFDLDGQHYSLAPPVVERYDEPALSTEVSVIVDGLHRVSLARALGIRELWVVDISDVPADFPVPALPLHWDDVRAVSTVPADRAKRTFRFPDLEQLYFFYRDLSSLGSRGVRQ